MSYNPTFDASTVYYANRALDWLTNPQWAKEIERLLATLGKLNLWTTENPNDDYFTLNRAFAEVSGQQPYGDRSFYLKGDTSKGNNLIRFLFGLQQLSSVVESICLGEHVHYLTGAGEVGLAFEEWGSHIYSADKTHGLWKKVQLSKKETEAYAAWVKSWATRDDLSYIEDAALEALSLPFLDLAACLYDTSSGLHHPMSVDASSPIVNMHLRWGTHLEKSTMKTPVLATDISINQLTRMVKYVINGLCYQRICIQKDIDYVLNSVRGPFLYSIHVTPPGDIERLRDVLASAVGLDNRYYEKNDWPKTFIATSEIKTTTLIFSLVLAEAQSTTDILPAAYRLRSQLTPLREYIVEHGCDAFFSKEYEKLLRHLRRRDQIDKALDVRIYGVTVPLPGDKLSWLYKPYYVSKKRKFLTSIRLAADSYRKMYFLSERLRELVKLNSQRAKKQLK